MATADETRTVALSEYAGVIERRWKVVALGALVGVLLSAAYLQLVTTNAIATAVVNVTAITTDPFDAGRSAAGLVDMETEAQAVDSMAVADRAALKLGEDVAPEDIRERLTVSTPASTTIIRISVSAPSPERARAEADAVAAAYLEHRSSLAADRIRRVLERDQERLQAMREQLSEANARLLLASDGTLEAIQAETDRELLTLRIDALLTRSGALEGIDTSGGQVLTAASSNAVAYTPRRWPIVIGGLLAGLVLGIVGAFVREARDARVRHGADIVTIGLGPVIARISDLATPLTPADEEQVEMVRETLLTSTHLGGGPKIVAFVEDKSVAQGWVLAAELARDVGGVGILVDVIVIPTPGPYAAELEARLGGRAVGGARPAGRLVRLRRLPARGGPWQHRVRKHVEDDNGDGLLLLVCPAQASDAERMTACRLADLAIVVATQRASLRAPLRALAAIAQTVRCPVIGTVLINHSRRPVRIDHSRRSSPSGQGPVPASPDPAPGPDRAAYRPLGEDASEAATERA